jgi:hypothetical protein
MASNVSILVNLILHSTLQQLTMLNNFYGSFLGSTTPNYGIASITEHSILCKWENVISIFGIAPMVSQIGKTFTDVSQHI